MSKQPFPVDPALTAITLAFKNKRYIADDVLPRTPVGKQEFKHRVYDLRESFTIPDTLVGRKSAPNEVGFAFTEVANSCDANGLDDPIPQDDIDNAAPNYDPVGRSVEELTNLILLQREKRVADLVFNPLNYIAANRVALTGNHCWSVFAQASGDSDPIEDITTGMRAVIMRPSIMVIGSDAFDVLSRHPNIIKAVMGTSADKGIATPEQIRALFRVDQVFIGESMASSAKKGQDAVMYRLWNDSCALLYRDVLAGPQNGTTFGYTAQWGSRVSGAKPDSNIGLKGGQRVRVGEYTKEVIAAGSLGYIITNCVA